MTRDAEVQVERGTGNERRASTAVEALTRAGPMVQRTGAMMAAPYNSWVSGARAPVARLNHLKQFSGS